MFPPGGDEDTDEDSEEEEDAPGGMSVNHFGPGILRQQGEIQFNDFYDELPDIQEIDDSGLVTGKVPDETVIQAVTDSSGPSTSSGPSSSKKARNEPQPEPEQLQRTANKNRLWSKTKPAGFESKLPVFEPSAASQAVTANKDIDQPYHFLRLFIPDQFIDNCVETSKLYCSRKNAPDKKSIMTPDNILTSIGLMYMSGYTTPAQKTLWWENRDDTQHLHAKRAMSSRLFKDVLRFTYFVKKEDYDETDSFWKVRPLFDLINSSAKQLIPQPERVCVDETIVRYLLFIIFTRAKTRMQIIINK